MPRTYNNKSNNIVEWTTQKIKGYYLQLHDSIYVSDCYGTKDLIILEMLARVLEKRSWLIRTTPEVVFEKF